MVQVNHLQNGSFDEVNGYLRVGDSRLDPFPPLLGPEKIQQGTTVLFERLRGYLILRREYCNNCNGSSAIVRGYKMNTLRMGKGWGWTLNFHW